MGFNPLSAAGGDVEIEGGVELKDAGGHELGRALLVALEGIRTELRAIRAHLQLVTDTELGEDDAN